MRHDSFICENPVYIICTLLKSNAIAEGGGEREKREREKGERDK